MLDQRLPEAMEREPEEVEEAALVPGQELKQLQEQAERAEPAEEKLRPERVSLCDNLCMPRLQKVQ